MPLVTPTKSSSTSLNILQNEQLRRTLHEIQYRKMSKTFTSAYMIVMDRTAGVINLKAGYTYIASYELFYNILKMSFSFYNTLARVFH